MACARSRQHPLVACWRSLQSGVLSGRCWSGSHQRAGEHPAVPGDTLAEPPVCNVTRSQADDGQHDDGVVMTPREQHDEADGRLWVTTWRVTGDPGRAVSGSADVLHCQGAVDDWGYCAYDRSTYSNTFTFNLTIPVSASTDFSIVDEVSCCELAQADLTYVNKFPWGSSFFDRKAIGPQTWCAVMRFATSTPTLHCQAWSHLVLPYHP